MGIAQDTLVSAQDQQEQDYKLNFEQALEDYANDALNNSDLIERADFNSKLAAKSAKGISSRSRSRSGVALTGQAAKHLDRVTDQTTKNFTEQSANSAVIAQDERNFQALSDVMNTYNEMSNTGVDALKEASGIEANREAGNRSRKAQANAANMSMAASLASAFLI